MQILGSFVAASHCSTDLNFSIYHLPLAIQMQHRYRKNNSEHLCRFGATQGPEKEIAQLTVFVFTKTSPFVIGRNINGIGLFSETETWISLLLQEVSRSKCWREEIWKSLVFKEVKIAQSKMATESTVLSYQVLLICTLYILTFGSHVRKLTSDDLRNIGQSTTNNFIAVLFDKPGELKISLILLLRAIWNVLWRSFVLKLQEKSCT